MSLAADTRAAVRARPFLLEALRAGVVNYAAAARAIDVAEDTEAVATALRRFADDLEPRSGGPWDARVTMHTGLDTGEADPMLAVGDHALVDGDGPFTGILATGGVDAAALRRALGLLDAHDVGVEAAGTAGSALLVVVERRDGAAALRLVERALEAVPAPLGGG